MLSLLERHFTPDNIPIVNKAAYGENRKCNTLAKYILAGAESLRKLSNISLYYFMRENQPNHYVKPTHIFKIAMQLDRVINDPAENKLEICLSMPPQHGKTELIKHFIAMYILKNPTKSVAYTSFNFTRAKKITRQIKQILEKYNMEFEPGAKTQDCFVFKQGGQLLTLGIGGGLTGEPVDLLVVDDPIKGQQEARSKVAHENVKEWFQMVGNSRKHEKTSTVVISTRWNEIDLIGYISEAYKDYEIINMPALSLGSQVDYLGREIDEALFPECKSKNFMQKVRDEEPKSVWETMYQGNPTPKEDRLFDYTKVQYYSKLPNKIACLNGVDLAYTVKESSDYTAFVTLAKDTQTNDVYLVNVERFKLPPAQCNAKIASLNLQYPYTIVVERNGTQIGANDYLESILIQNNCKKLRQEQISGDKYTRALKFSSAWNNGKIYLPNPKDFPEATSWLQPFIQEVTKFTGVNDKHDDMLDAVTVSFNLLSIPSREPQVYKL